MSCPPKLLLLLAAAGAFTVIVVAGCPGGVDPPPNGDETPEGWRSVLYPEDWTPAFGLPDGRFIHDFSYAGYHASEIPLPEELPSPLRSVLEDGADPTGERDSTSAIQATMDALVGGGTVHLPAGLYRVDGELNVTRDGVVIRGDGASETFVHFTREENNTDGAGLWFRGRSPSEGEWPLARDAVGRSMSVFLDDSAGLSVGDEVALGFVITDAFREDHGMGDYWGFSAGAWRAFARRTVVAIDHDEVLLDVPVRYPALVRDLASLRRDDGYLTEVGLVDLSVSTVVSEEAAMAFDRHHAIAFERVRDGFVRGVGSFAAAGGEAHLQSGGILVVHSRRVTIAESEMGRAQNRGGGGNGYLFEISRSNEILIRDSVGRDGRHNFIQNWDFGTSGCVFLRTESRGGVKEHLFNSPGLSEYHHALAHANLVDDSIADDGWEAKNRHGYSSGSGHAATESVFWNLRGEGQLWSMQYGWGYVIGTGPDLEVYTALDTPDITMGAARTEPEDHVEGLGEAETLIPRSLFEDQLARRLAGSSGGS